MRLGAFFFEIMPLAGFFIGFHYFGLFVAAAISVGLAGIVWGCVVAHSRCCAFSSIFTAFVSRLYRGSGVVRCGHFHQDSANYFQWLICGCLAWWIDNETRHDAGIFRQTIFLTNDTWYRLSARWGWFFLCLAVANELVWRHASDADWVVYKTFIAAPASVLFMMAQLPLTMRGRLHSAKTDHG